MSWMEKLYETYELCSSSKLPDAKNLVPIAHTTQKAHVEIVLDGKGNFRRAQLVSSDDPDQPCLIPATERSAGRTGNDAPHPLCDKIQFCAGDYEKFGGTKKIFFDSYLAQLSAWADSDKYSHSKVRAIRTYVNKRCVIEDLVRVGVLHAKKGKLTTEAEKTDSTSDNSSVKTIFDLLTNPEQGDAFVRWRVEEPGVKATGTWEDRTLVNTWQTYEGKDKEFRGLCYVLGYGEKGQPQVLADQHPAKIRNGADKAKLISSNDNSGFTFLGRFTDSDQPVGISFEVTQKAHSALRWLIGRKQAFRNGDQCIVAWAASGHDIPEPWAATDAMLGIESTDANSVGDIGQNYAQRLRKALAGYRSNLKDNKDIAVMGVDSATPGRMSITYYRELPTSNFLDKIEAWHETYAWEQNFGKELKFVGVPSPRDIAEAAYGRRLDEKLKKATVEKLLPCILDGQPFPRDLLSSVYYRTTNRVGLERWEWEKNLGIACALYRGVYQQRRYLMTLEEDKTTRDYLYGRLLAIAEKIEAIALTLGGEDRPTTAARLMQRFADRPFSTWRTIELSLTPYKARLKNSRAGFLVNMDKLIDRVMGAFENQDKNNAFTNDKPLSGEFLLGYHCQRQSLFHKDETQTKEEN